MAILTPASVISPIAQIVNASGTTTSITFYAGDANGDVSTVTVRAIEAGQSTAAWSTTIAVANLVQLGVQQYRANISITSMAQSLTRGTSYALSLSWSDGNDSAAYSDMGQFRLYDPPTVTITSPGATVTGLPLGITWSITDTTGVSGQGVFVYPQGGTPADRVYYWGYDTTTRALSVPTSEISLTNGATYTVAVSVSNGVGLQNYATKDFTVSWTPPAVPSATVTNNAATLTATIAVTAGSGTPATSALMVTRNNADGSTWVVGDSLSSGDSVTDPLPPLGVAYSYTITAVAASGATSTKTVSNTIEPPGWAFNFGNQAAISYLLKYNVTSSQSLKHGGELYHFADGGAGNGLPVWYGTTDRDINGSISFNVKSMADVDQLNGHCMTYPIAWLRDPYGHRWRAHVLPSVSQGLKRTWDMSVSWDAVRFQEAW